MKKEDIVVLTVPKRAYNGWDGDIDKRKLFVTALEKQFDVLLPNDWRLFVCFIWSESYFQIKPYSSDWGRPIIRKRLGSDWTISDKTLLPIYEYIDLKKSKAKQAAIHADSIDSLKKKIEDTGVLDYTGYVAEDVSPKSFYVRKYKDSTFLMDAQVRVFYNEDGTWGIDSATFYSEEIKTIAEANRFILEHKEEGEMAEAIAFKLAEKLNDNYNGNKI